MSKRAEERRRQRQGGSGGGSGGQGLKPLHWLLIGVGGLALVLVAWNMFSSMTDSTVRQPVEVTYESPRELLELSEGVRIGPADAPVVIMEFADYACPSCQTFARNVKPLLDLTYGDDDRVQYVFHDYPFLPNAFIAARAARCAGAQGDYWSYHDELFRAQTEWSRAGDPVSNFEGYAQEIGLDRGAFRSCLRSDEFAVEVSANAMLGRQLGVDGTPHLIIGTGDGGSVRVQDWNNTDRIREVVNQALARLAPATPDEPGDEG